MSSNKILLGIALDGEAIYLEKHEWACDWYWSFGYLGNLGYLGYRGLHFHLESYLQGAPRMPKELFRTTNISEAEWWIIRDLFIQAYALKKAAEVYQWGGHQTTAMGLTDLIRSKDKAKALNADLERVLAAAWAYCSAAAAKKEAVA